MVLGSVGNEVVSNPMGQRAFYERHGALSWPGSVGLRARAAQLLTWEGTFKLR